MQKPLSDHLGTRDLKRKANSGLLVQASPNAMLALIKCQSAVPQKPDNEQFAQLRWVPKFIKFKLFWLKKYAVRRTF
jgi:hypothetical protein